MIVALAACAAVGLALIAFGDRLGRLAFALGTIPLAGVVVWTAVHLDEVTDGEPVTEQLSWVGRLDITIDLRLDGLAATMSLIVAGVGVLVLAYSMRYFGRSEEGIGRIAGLLVLFGGAMLGLVQADHVVVLYTCWELTSVASYLLIGNRHDDPRARAAALQALLVTGLGGLALLGGLVMLAQEAGTFRLSELVADPPASSGTVIAGLVLVIVGALTKSAQYPFHSWLPGAMAAPTPISAYLHSATMVKAGVFLVARLAPAFATSGVWRPLVLGAGCVTLVFGGLRALRQHDLKLLLAFGTVSQLGLLVVLFGAGTPDAAAAGWALLVAHAAFKAALFMVVGIIDHETGTRDIRVIPPLEEGWRVLEVVTILALASMAGVVFGAGFIAKELAYDAFGEEPFRGSVAVLAVVVVGSMLTVAYAVRFYWGAFVRPRRRQSTAHPLAAVAPPAGAFVAPAALLAAEGVVLGVLPGVEDSLLNASLALFPGHPQVHLAIWHGWSAPLLLSVVTLAGGALLALADGRVQPLLARGAIVPSGAAAYLGLLRGIGALSVRTTGLVQNGSLPVYAGIILATAAVLPAVAILGSVGWPGWPALGSARELPVALALVMAALGAAILRTRFSAALFLGVAGYAMAALFVLSGAPDLALTQAAVETLSTVVFVLVLRRLPERFVRRSTARRRAVRAVIATGVGVTVFVFAVVAAGYRIGAPVSLQMVTRAVPDGHGANVVNVILVDFRGFDTLGEITVLAVASIGCVALARAGRRPDFEHVPRGPSDDFPRLAFVDVSVQVIFHAVLMTSLWLLFSGHNQPGGGFVGGLLAGSAITLRYIAGGIDLVRGRSRFKPWTVLGVGLLLAATTAAVPIVAGGDVLEIHLSEIDLPVLGELTLSSALAFDTGVYLAVVGMVLMAYEAFGDQPVEEVTA